MRTREVKGENDRETRQVVGFVIGHKDERSPLHQGAIGAEITIKRARQVCAYLGEEFQQRKKLNQTPR